MTPCIVWPGAKNNTGYGVKRVAGKNQLVHRWIVGLVFGSDAVKGKVVRHHCDNPACFRFDHLGLGTHRQNSQDMVRRGRARGARKFLKTEVLDIRNRVAAGERRVAVAKTYRVTKGTISQIVLGESYAEIGGPRTPHPWRKVDSPEFRAEVRSLLATGISHRAIGRQLGISHTTISTTIKNMEH